jgi:hypothetical protein
MFGSNVLEVAIGVVFVYLLMSLICSTINEQVIARLFALRSKTLEDGIKTMLNDPTGEGFAKAFYDNPLIKSMAKQGVFDKAIDKVPVINKVIGGDGKPSYISSSTFALVIKDIAATNPDTIPPALKTLLDQATGDVQQELASIEKWFDDTMDRVSGWYKRKVQLILLALALIITVYLNVDSMALINSVSNNAILRASIVSAAQGTDKSSLDNTNLTQIQTNFQKIQPTLGWTTTPQSANDWILKIVGLLATTLAVSLGAPFWFDLLSKIMQIRAVGDLPPPSTPSIQISASSNQAGTSSIKVSALSNQSERNGS